MRKFALLLAAIGVVAHAESFRDCSTCPEMVTVPAGSFVMGIDGRGDLGPAHTVSLPAFAIGRFEVTQGEWKALMGTNPSKFVDCGDNCPVERVTWPEAQEFVKRLADRTGKRYALPSEAQWEYACRAGQQTDWCGGNEFDKVEWAGDEYGSTHPVGQKLANAWGLFDMSGNVWEWTQDCAHPDYTGAPTDGSAWEVAGECKSRMLRGGSWLSGPQYGRVGLRFGFTSTFRAHDFGFRVVREAK
ncbi:MAG TPA: formylglycine-generating enzyme family protein [Rhodocyclaceae bacterium]|nr:formylglycine-generating enzyme family protein [Rhodocyclaceae bacterium]